MKMANSRINLEMNQTDVIVALGEGNPGATVVCMEILQQTPDIDPQAALGGLGHLLMLDTFQIYGSRIWMLYKDVCGQDLVKTLALLRACQLGKLSNSKLNHAIDNFGEGVDVDEMLSIVRNTLKDFSPIDEPEEVALEEAV